MAACTCRFWRTAGSMNSSPSTKVRDSRSRQASCHSPTSDRHNSTPGRHTWLVERKTAYTAGRLVLGGLKMKRNTKSMYQLLSAAVLACLLPTSVVAANDNHDIVVLSNRADLISGGDALVELIVPPGTIQALGSGGNVKIQASIDGVPVPKDTFALRPDGRIFGLVKGLKVGQNVLTAQVPGKSMSIVITKSPIGGPVFAGAQVQPWICATPTPVPESGNTPASNASGLTTVAFDSQCNIAAEYKLFYRTTTPGCSSALPDPSPPAPAPTNNCFKPYTLGSTPADLAMTTTTAGLTVPYVVRVERGTLNRGIYDIAVLFDPTQTQPWTAV